MKSEHPERPVEDGAGPDAQETEEAAAPAAEEADDGGPCEAEPDPELVALREENERLLRLLADGENQVRRVQRERAREVELFRGQLVERLLPVIDDFHRALEQLPAGEEAGYAEGLRLVAQRLEESLGELGLSAIPALGEPFDPHLHEALLQLPNTDAAKGVIVQELQRGYRLGERVIRPSKVAVAG